MKALLLLIIAVLAPASTAAADELAPRSLYPAAPPYQPLAPSQPSGWPTADGLAQQRRSAGPPADLGDAIAREAATAALLHAELQMNVGARLATAALA
jgi:hypothetical protein